MGVLALAALAALVFGPLARAGFVYDDLWFLVRNPAVRHFTPLAFFLKPETFAGGQPGLALNNFRPLAVLSFALDYALWGLRPSLYHLENVAWHVLNAALVLALARRWLKTPAGAWLAACVFLIHPVQVETVAWVAQRSNLLCAAGVLAALWLLLEREDARSRAAALAAYAAALYCKEEAVVLPALLWLCDAREGRAWKSRRRDYAGLIALTAAYAASRTLLGHPWSQFSPGQSSLRADLMLGAASFATYLGKLLVPVALRPSYDYPAFNAWLVAGGAALALSCAACGFYRRRSIAGLALLWTCAALLPVLHLAPLRPFVAERFLYLPVAGAGLLAGRLFERGGAARWAAAVWAALLCVQAIRAVPHWMTERSLWASAVAAEPANAFARVCYAGVLDDPAQAEAQYKAALTDQPSEASRFAALNNLSDVLLREKKAKEAEYWAALALKDQPDDVHALYNLCRAYDAAGDPRRSAACAALRRRQSALSLP